MSALPRRVITGHRRCVRCRYSLSGQPIIRDEAYALVLVRCPECGTVASTQHHPLLGRWCGFWTAVLSVSFGLAVGALLLLCTGSLMLFAKATTEIACQDYATQLAREYRTAVDPDRFLMSVQGPQAPGTPPLPATRPLSFGEWWLMQDQAARLAQAGGWWRAITPLSLLMWLLLLPLAGAWGVFWSVAMRQRWPGRVVQAVVIGAIVLCFAAPTLLAGPDSFVWWSNQAAVNQIGRPIFLASIAAAMLSLSAGLAIGRPLARRMLRATIPQRFLGPLATLWLRDGARLWGEGRGVPHVPP